MALIVWVKIHTCLEFQHICTSDWGGAMWFLYRSRNSELAFYSHKDRGCLENAHNHVPLGVWGIRNSDLYPYGSFQQALGQFAAECEAARKRIRNSWLEPWSSVRKGSIAKSRLGESCWVKVFWGLFTSGGRKMGDWQAEGADVVPDYRGEERAELEGQATRWSMLQSSPMVMHCE